MKYYEVTSHYSDNDKRSGYDSVSFMSADSIEEAVKQVEQDIAFSGGTAYTKEAKEISESDYWLELAIETVNYWNDKKLRENHQFFRELDSYETEDVFVLKARHSESLHKAIESQNVIRLYTWIAGHKKCPFASQEWFDITALKMLDIKRMAEKLKKEDSRSVGAFYGD